MGVDSRDQERGRRVYHRQVAEQAAIPQVVCEQIVRCVVRSRSDDVGVPQRTSESVFDLPGPVERLKFDPALFAPAAGTA